MLSLWFLLRILQLHKLEIASFWRNFFSARSDSSVESLGEGESSFCCGERRERVLEERGHATPRATTVPEFPLELLTSASLSLVSSSCSLCFDSSTILRLISLHCRFACIANTRYNVDAAVGTSLNQSPITRVITNPTSVEGTGESREGGSSTTALKSPLFYSLQTVVKLPSLGQLKPTPDP